MLHDHTTPHWPTSALVIIDLQRDFIDAGGALPVPGTAEVVKSVSSLAQAFRVAGRPIVQPGCAVNG